MTPETVLLLAKLAFPHLSILFSVQHSTALWGGSFDKTIPHSKASYLLTLRSAGPMVLENKYCE